MDSKICLLFSFFFLFCNANAFNITKILEQFPDFSTFNNYLTQTQLAGAINSRQTITVLVVDNDNISPLSGKPADVLKKIMGVHVVLDYYDVKKLQNLSNKTAILTTLYQSTGQASGQLGFLNVTNLNTGSVVIGSAAKGATLGANLVKSISAQPYNISILQISTAIIPLGIENAKANSPSSSPAPVPAVSPTMSPTPAKSPTMSPPKPSHGPAPAAAPSDASAPADAPSKASAPADAPSKASAPAGADTPSTAPGSSPRTAPGSPPQPAAPTADAPAADAANPPSVGSKLQFSLSELAIVVSSAMCLLLRA